MLYSKRTLNTYLYSYIQSRKFNFDVKFFEYYY